MEPQINKIRWRDSNTYKDDDDHVTAKFANLIPFRFLSVVDDLSDEKGSDDITEHTTDKEAHADRNTAALTLGVSEDPLLGSGCLFF